jgi:hypothetical protein
MASYKVSIICLSKSFAPVWRYLAQFRSLPDAIGGRGTEGFNVKQDDVIDTRTAVFFLFVLGRAQLQGDRRRVMRLPSLKRSPARSRFGM